MIDAFRPTYFGAVALGLCLMTQTFAQEVPQDIAFGSLAYAARGNIQLDEGTLDMWVISNFDTREKLPDAKGGDRRAALLCDLVFPEEKWHYPLFFIGWSNAFAFVGYTVPNQPYVWAGPDHWKPGEAHHVVLTWSGRKRSAYIDGGCVWTGGKGQVVSRDVDAGGPIQGDLTQAEIVIGRAYSIITVDEIQIRNVALTPEQIAAAKDAPLAADRYTLLLDHCDGSNAEVISGVTGEAGRQLTGSYKLVDGKFGKAIQFWAEKAPTP